MSALAGLLDGLVSGLDTLHATLRRENEALAVGTPDTLPTLIQAKEHLIGDLARTWSALAARLGVPVSRRMIGQALNDHGEPGLAQTWSRVQALAQEVDRLNRLNGRLIEEQLRRTQGALQILQSAARQRGLYGSDGRTVDLFDPQRSIDEA